MTEASLEVMACNWANLEGEAQDLKSKLHQLPKSGTYEIECVDN